VYTQEITHVALYPENPTNTDEILLIVSTSFPMLDCRLDSIHPYYACGAFSFDAFYNTGFQVGNCERTDTISLGVLENGFYLITYRMLYLGWSQVDQADTTITVGTTGVSSLTTDEDEILLIFPNPSKGNINIRADLDKIDKLRIVNASGSFVSDIDIDNAQADVLNAISLLPGLYICTAFNNGRPVSSTRFIVLDD